VVIAAATETPRGERSHAVGEHVAEGHWRVAARWWHSPRQSIRLVALLRSH